MIPRPFSMETSDQTQRVGMRGHQHPLRAVGRWLKSDMPLGVGTPGPAEVNDAVEPSARPYIETR